MEKVIKDGKVGVLVSPSYGGGFSTWGYPLEAVFDPELIRMVEIEDYEGAVKYCESKWPNEYSGGVSDLVVVWVNEGSKFRITEYDGYEDIEFEDGIDWITA